MVTRKMLKLFLNSLIIYLLVITQTYAINDFKDWVNKFQTKAIKSGISEKVVKDIMSNAKFYLK